VNAERIFYIGRAVDHRLTDAVHLAIAQAAFSSLPMSPSMSLEALGDDIILELLAHSDIYPVLSISMVSILLKSAV
jgi:hypothetical protein